MTENEQGEQPVTDLSSLPAILTAQEAASLLRVSEKTIKDWCRAARLPGAFKLPGQKEWRIRRDVLLAWIEKGGEDEQGAR